MKSILQKEALFLAALLLIAGCSSPGISIHSPPSTELNTPMPTLTTAAISGNLTVYFIDVGQGDSILIDLGDTEVLIDAGVRSPVVADFVKLFIDGPLDVMVATHGHADHIGGLIDVLARYQVADIWTSGGTADTATYRDFMAGVNAEGAKIHQAERGQRVTAGAMTFTVLNPGRPLPSDANNTSVVLALSYGDVDFLFTGDAEQEAEASMLVSSVVPVPDTDILKVGHHASRTASSVDFMNITKPEVAIYMAGVGNTYGHPHPETITALKNIGAIIYGTDLNGTISVTTNGTGYLVRTER